MIDDRFSAKMFEECGLDSEKAKFLADLLAQEIQQELHELIWPRVLIIIKKLNSLGHNLRPYGEQIPGDISFRDDFESDSVCRCKLRIAMDLIVSTGYAHLIAPEENE